jgi:hypothetical protein
MRITRSLSTTLIPFLVLLGAAALVFALALTFVVSLWADIRISAWNVVAAQIGRWIALWLGVHTIHNVLPVAIAHGRTRREFLGQAVLFWVLASLVMALIARGGFFVETLVYDAMDWTRHVTGNGALEYWQMYAVWTAVGAFVAAGFDRFQAGGVLTIPVGFALIIPAGSAVNGADWLPFVGRLPGQAAAGVLLCVGAFVVASALAWLIARDMPVRVKAA